MDDELVDVIDIKNKTIGQDTKFNVHQKGLRHRVSAVLVVNDNGKYLIPTALNKKVEAGLLNHSAAGHVPFGETYLESAKRELQEETGLIAKVEDFKYLGNFWMKKDYKVINVKERFEVFITRYHPKMGIIRLNDEQVDEKWLSKEELKKLFKESPQKFSYPLSLTCKDILKL